MFRVSVRVRVRSSRGARDPSQATAATRSYMLLVARGVPVVAPTGHVALRGGVDPPYATAALADCLGWRTLLASLGVAAAGAWGWAAVPCSRVELDGSGGSILLGREHWVFSSIWALWFG